MWVPTLTLGLVVCALAACGEDLPSVSALCLERPEPMEAALARAPAGGPVALTDGTTIAQCVERTVRDADLQSLGVVLTAVADHLVRRVEDDRDADAARQLGWLVGATQRGAERTNGVSLELARRVGLVAGRLELPTALDEALRAGRADGERAG